MTTPTKEQILAAYEIAKIAAPLSRPAFEQLLESVATVLARAESAEAERDGLLALIREKVGNCCGEQAGKCMCDSFGCGTLMGIAALAAGEGAAR